MYIPSGIIPPVPTFINEDYSLDKKGMGAVVDSLISQGVHGLFFLGTGGEFAHLSMKERKEIAEFAVSFTGGRVPVLIGTGTTSTRATLELNAHAAEIGADAAVVINPYYFNFSDEHLFGHFDTVISQSKIPVVLYNFPGLTGQSIPVSMIGDLARKHEHLVGIKNTVDNVSNTKAILNETREVEERFSVLAGFDDYILSGLFLGCKGAITGTGNIMPERSVALYNHFANEEFKQAMEEQQVISRLCNIYSLDTPFVGVIKAAVKSQGLPVTGLTFPPLNPLSSESVDKMEVILKACKE